LPPGLVQLRLDYLETWNLIFILDRRNPQGPDPVQEGTMTYDELKPRIAGVSVDDLDEKSVSLESLWQGRRIVLAFLRHFG